MWKIYHSSETFNRQLQPGLKLPDQNKGNLSDWFEENAIIIRDFGGKSTRRRAIGFMQCGDFELCIKKYGTALSVGQTRMSIVHSYLRRCSALRKYNYHQKLFGFGIPVPEPYACLYGRNDLGHPIATYVISQKLEEAESLTNFWNKEHLAMEKKLQAFARLGRIVAHFHDCGYMHGDLGGENVMLNENEVFIIDMDCVRRLPRLFSTPKVAMDVARFMVGFPADDPKTAKDVYTGVSLFFTSYCEASGIESSRLLTFVHQALGRLKKRYTRKHLENRLRQVELAYGTLRYLQS